MSQENVELVRSIFDGWSRGDFGVGWDLMTPDFEWRQHREAVEPGSHRGAGIERALENIFEIYEDFHVEAERYIDAGDAVVVFGRTIGRARRSGLAMDRGFAFVWTVEGGRLVRLQVYSDRSEALEAVGLRE
jgi:ketosteroid isomerase-like protein